MNEKKIRIILVDDHPSIRHSWKVILENNPRIQVIAECAHGSKALELARQYSPDIMLVDINLCPLNGFTVTQTVVDKIPSIKIIGISINNQPRYASRMMELGAMGYITKTSALDEIYLGIDEVHKGHYFICEEIKRHLPSLKRKAKSD